MEKLTYAERSESPDGKRVVSVDDGKIVVRDIAVYAASQAEMAQRFVEQASPKPRWHANEFDWAVQSQDWFAARFQLDRLRAIQGRGDCGVSRHEFRYRLHAGSKPVVTK